MKPLVDNTSRELIDRFEKIKQAITLGPNSQKLDLSKLKTDHQLKVDWLRSQMQSTEQRLARHSEKREAI